MAKIEEKSQIKSAHIIPIIFYNGTLCIVYGKSSDPRRNYYVCSFGGFFKPDETREQCAIREFEEESSKSIFIPNLEQRIKDCPPGKYLFTRTPKENETHHNHFLPISEFDLDDVLSQFKENQRLESLKEIPDESFLENCSIVVIPIAQLPEKIMHLQTFQDMQNLVVYDVFGIKHPLRPHGIPALKLLLTHNPNLLLTKDIKEIM